jgi:O-antigen/teichoic acid export membrane protein
VSEEQPPPSLPLVPVARDATSSLTVRTSGSAAPTIPAAVERRSAPAWGRIVGPVLAGAVTVYLGRALGPASYGRYALALAIGAATLYAGWVALPLILGRFLADDPDLLDPADRAVWHRPTLRFGCTVMVAAVVFALAGPIAHAYGWGSLGWPLRWSAVAVAGQALVLLFAERSDTTRESVFGAWILGATSVVQAVDMVALVAHGAGVAGAVLGRIAGYLVAAAGLILFTPGELGSGQRPSSGGPTASRIPWYASALAAADVTWIATFGLAVIVVSPFVSAAALGRLGVALTLTAVLGYAGYELSGGLFSSVVRGRDPAAVAQRLRFLVRWQGAVVAVLAVWSDPIMHLLFGNRYGAGAGALRALAVSSFAAAPAWLLTLVVTRFARVRTRLVVTGLSFEAGLLAVYLLTSARGIVGAAVGVDVLLALYLGSHLWIAASIVDLQIERLMRSLIRTAAAGIAMAVVLYVAGTAQLSVVGWLTGTLGGTAAFLAVLLATGEISAGGRPL